MMNDQRDSGQDVIGRGLCASCRHAREVVNDRGSTFVFCQKSQTDPAFPRYPRLPVVACTGYEVRGST